MSTKNYNYGDTVLIATEAPDNYRPGAIASIYAIRVIENSNTARKYKAEIGSILYGVEFGDGSSVELPERFLKPFEGS